MGPNFTVFAPKVFGHTTCGCREGAAHAAQQWQVRETQWCAMGTTIHEEEQRHKHRSRGQRGRPCTADKPVAKIGWRMTETIDVVNSVSNGNASRTDTSLRAIKHKCAVDKWSPPSPTDARPSPAAPHPSRRVLTHSTGHEIVRNLHSVQVNSLPEIGGRPPDVLGA